MMTFMKAKPHRQTTNNVMHEPSIGPKTTLQSVIKRKRNNLRRRWQLRCISVYYMGKLLLIKYGNYTTSLSDLHHLITGSLVITPMTIK